ncbi:MAG: PKD domain-containing protein [Bacteroidia bacterium]
MKRVTFLSTMLVLFFVSCNKPNYNACFTLDRSTVNPGDIINITNCSDFDGEETRSKWDFGDGFSIISTRQDPMTHAYGTSGQFTIKLTIGEKENTSEFTRTVVVQ